MSDLPRYVTANPDQHGKVRYRFRRKGYPSAYIHGEPGSAQFHREYAQALDAKPAEPKPVKSPAPVKPRSLDHLYRQMRASPAWKDKAARTQHVQAQVYERFLNRRSKSGDRYGDRPVASVTVGWLDKVFGAMSETPGAANDLRKKLSVMLGYAEGLRWLPANPVPHTGKFKSGKGFHSWTEDEIAQYRAVHPLGTMARLTLELALNTAARRGGVATLSRENLSGGRILTDHAKGNNSASVPMLATTRAALDALPAAPIRHLVIGAHGRPYSVGGLGNRFRKWCDEAGLPHCSIHGLRKALSRRMAEAGGTDAEGMAVTGHKKPGTFADYRAAANRSGLADRVMSNVEARFEGWTPEPLASEGNSDVF